MKNRYLPAFIGALSISFLNAASAQTHTGAPDAKPAMATPAASELKKLIAVIRPVGNSSVKGTVVFEKAGNGVMVTAKIGGLSKSSHNAMHIHQFGDLASDDGTSAGDHFNPGGHEHGMPDKEMRHAGDLGNLETDSEGNATLTITVHNITLDNGPMGILGRSVIVHAKPDDGGQPSGNAGPRIGAGVIGISKDAGPQAAAKPASPPANVKVEP